MKKILILTLLSVSLTPPALAFDFGDLFKGAIEQRTQPESGPESGPESSPAASGQVDTLSKTEINSGLKEALTRGAATAIAQLGAPNGFFGNDALRIPLPKGLQKAEKAMKLFGMGDQADALVLSMNRAAEAAVPEARTLLVSAVKSMTLKDAKGILTGGNTSATDFFRAKTQAKLTERFLPIVSEKTDTVGLAQQYNRYAGLAAQYGAIDKTQANVADYVTREALDRLYRVIGEKEAAIRANPLQAGSDLLKKVFGAVAGH